MWISFDKCNDLKSFAVLIRYVLFVASCGSVQFCVIWRILAYTCRTFHSFQPGGARHSHAYDWKSEQGTCLSISEWGHYSERNKPWIDEMWQIGLSADVIRATIPSNRLINLSCHIWPWLICPQYRSQTIYLYMNESLYLLLPFEKKWFASTL